MKQLQWDKLAQQQVGKTVWGVEENDREREWIKKLKEQRIWEEMEEDFKAKQLVIILMGTLMFHAHKFSCYMLHFRKAEEGRATKCFGHRYEEARRFVILRPPESCIFIHTCCIQRFWFRESKSSNLRTLP